MRFHHHSLLISFHVAAEVDISGREITLEKVSKEVMSGFSTSGELVLRDLDKGIELVNVTFEFFQLCREGREVFIQSSTFPPKSDQLLEDSSIRGAAKCSAGNEQR